ncbi:MAG: choice-of-anchor D domain-containing protein [Candidatus Cloacimonetes bacterium]|nr:choice-of-anchor D domain-containing protein [Candidatus Cloacimonadota bacterium]
MVLSTKNFRQQFLYLASEIEDAGGGAGPINSLAFNVENVNTCSPMPNFTIRIKTTTQTALTTTFEDGDYTVVFTENDFLPTDGMNVHQFIAPFAWDGASNLIVDIMTSLIPGAYTQNASVYYSTTAFNSSLRYQNDSTEASTATTGSTGTMRSNVTFNMSGVSITNPPNPAQLVAPANGSTLNTPVANLSWGSGGGLPTGYKLYLGTTNPPAFVEDLGLVTTYEANDLEFETLYYWQIVPYNAIGDAVDCPVWSFTTMPNPIVSNFPWTVDFGTTSADWMPAYWTQFAGLYPTVATGTQWFHDDWLNDATSGNKAAKINIYGSTRNGWLVTPPINLPGGDFQLSFDAALMVWNGTTAPTTPQEDDRFMIIMSDNADMSNPTILREWNNTGSEYVFNNIPHDGQNYSISLAGLSGIKYFAFYGESTVTGNGDNDLMVDNVSITGGGATENPIFSITPASHNFGELEVNETASISFSISNAGTGSLGIQSITIAGSEMINLANLPTLPTALNAGQTASFTVNYAPTAAGTHTATVTVTDNINRVAHNVSISGSAVSGGTEDLDPPTNLAANVSGNDVHLSWTAPGDTPPPPRMDSLIDFDELRKLHSGL